MNGVAYADLLYMRSPGEPLEVPLYFMATSDKNLSVFNHETASSSLVNLLNLTFKNVRNRGVLSYDTKISATEFIAAVRSFSLQIYDSSNPATPDLNVYTRHDNSADADGQYYQGSPRMYAYVNNGTWWIRADYTDSRFVTASGSPSTQDGFNIKLQILVYKKLITKPFAVPISIDLNGANGSSATLSTPPNF